MLWKAGCWNLRGFADECASSWQERLWNGDRTSDERVVELLEMRSRYSNDHNSVVRGQGPREGRRAEMGVAGSGRGGRTDCGGVPISRGQVQWDQHAGKALPTRFNGKEMEREGEGGMMRTE